MSRFLGRQLLESVAVSNPQTLKFSNVVILMRVIAASDFLTIGLLVALEGLLSADNAMVLAVLVLGLPKRDQRKALRYGILGAFAFRTIATLLAVYLIKLGWVKLAGAGYLLYLAFRHFFLTDAEERRKAPPA